MKNILITGGAGFIGSHLIKFFVKKYSHYNIINLDNLSYAGNLNNLRDFSHVDDVANALIQIARKGVPGESYVISSSKLEKISKIISILKKLTKKNFILKKNIKLFRKFDEKFILGDNKKIKKLKWKSKKNIEDIIKDIIF